MAEVYTASHAAAPSGNAILVDSPYQVDWVGATGAGVAGALGLLAVHAFIYLGYGANSLNLPLMFGYFVTADYVLAQIIGLGAVIGLYVTGAWAYAFLLSLFRMQGNGGKGVVYGFMFFVPLYAFILPWVIGLTSRWGAPHINSSFLPNMDVMMNQAGQGNVGWEAVALVAFEHLLYGLLVGAVYRHKVLPIGERYRLRYLGD